MVWRQLRDADMTVGYEGGWCLKYVQDAFHTDHISPTAMDDWNRQPNRHYDLPPEGITVPVYFRLGNVPAGHVAIRLDDGYVASSTLSGEHSVPYFHPNIDDLIQIYGRYNGGCTYLGWAEHVGSVHVVEYVPDVVTATADEVKQAYLDILGRDADADGLNHYTTNGMTIGQVREDLLASSERQLYLARLKAEEDARAAAEAKAEADAATAAAAKAHDEEVAKAQAQAAALAAEAAAQQKAKEDALTAQGQAEEAATSSQQNQLDIGQVNGLVALLKQLIQSVLNKFFKGE